MPRGKLVGKFEGGLCSESLCENDAANGDVKSSLGALETEVPLGAEEVNGRWPAGGGS